jgi:hypothetical protein
MWHERGVIIAEEDGCPGSYTIRLDNGSEKSTAVFRFDGFRFDGVP